MTIPPLNPAHRLLDMLDQDEIEQLPLNAVKEQLREYGVDATVPDRVRKLVDAQGGPAEYLLSRLEVEEVERQPLRKVIADLEKKGVTLSGANEAAGKVEFNHPEPPHPSDDTRWLRRHWIIALVLAAGWMIVGAQVMLIETVQGALAGPTYFYAVATYLLGTIPGAVLLGSLADRIGRKPVYTATALIYIATGFATALLPPDLYGFAVMRFLVGLAAGADYVVLNIALQELMPKHRRGWACLAVNSTFWLGLAAVELISPFPDGTGTGAIMDRWQDVFRIVGLLGVVLLALRWIVPESPRRFQLRVPARALDLSLIGQLWGEYRRQTLVCLALILSQSLFYNAFAWRFNGMLEAFYSGVEGPIASKHLIYYIAVANFLGPLLLGRWFDEVGRKTMIWASYMISGCLMLWVSALLLLNYLPPSSVAMTVVLATIFFFASTAASSAYLTLGESFPTEIRATTFSLLFGTGMFVGVFGSLLYGWLTGDLQDAPQHAGDVQQYEQVALSILGALAGAAMVMAAVVEKAFGTEYALSPPEEGEYASSSPHGDKLLNPAESRPIAHT